MTIEEIRANAPEEATHYFKNRYTGVTYIKKLDKNGKCKAWGGINGWTGSLTMCRSWFFCWYWKIWFDSDPWATTQAFEL